MHLYPPKTECGCPSGGGIKNGRVHYPSFAGTQKTKKCPGVRSNYVLHPPPPPPPPPLLSPIPWTHIGFFIVDINKRSCLTSCVFWFVVKVSFCILKCVIQLKSVMSRNRLWADILWYYRRCTKLKKIENNKLIKWPMGDVFSSYLVILPATTSSMIHLSSD